MKTTPVASPHQVGSNIASGHKQAEAKARAIAKLTGSPTSDAHSQPATQVVANQSNIAVEEMGAIIPTPNIQTDNNTTEETQIETQSQEPKQQSQEDKDSLARQHQQLVRRERQLRQQAQKQAQELKAREDALKAREAELTAKDNKYNTEYVSKDTLKQKTLQTLIEQGIPYDDIVQQMLNQSQLDPRVEAYMSKQDARIQQLERVIEDSKKAQADSQTQQYQAAVKQIKTDVKVLVDTDPNFEAIKFTRSYDDVVELITKTYDQDGILLTVEEASEKVENYLVEEAAKLAKLNKVQKRNNPVAPAKPAPQKTQETKQPQPMKTLTNAVSGSRQLSAKERAILAFKGQLDKG